MQIPNAQSLTPKQKEDLITYICYKHQKHNIMNLRKVVGDEGLLALLNKFAGTYTRFPTITNIVELANKVHLITLYDELKAAAVSGNPKTWQDAEDKFVKFAQNKFEMTYPNAKLHVKKLKIELQAAQQWNANITAWEKRNDPANGK